MTLEKRQQTLEQERQQNVAGLVRVRCTCCDEPLWLVEHPELDDSRRLCPASHRTYLDRGDGLFEADGGVLQGVEVAAQGDSEPDVVSDRPRRTGPKTRIQLERATFACR